MIKNFRVFIDDYKLLLEISKEYKNRLFLCILSFTLTSFLEIFSILAIIPILAIFTKDNTEKLSFFNDIIFKIFDFINKDPTLLNLLTLIILITLIRVSIQFLSKVFISYTQMKIITDYRLKLLKYNIRARLDFLNNMRSGLLLNLINTNANSIGRAFNSVCVMFSVLIKLIVFLSSALFISITTSLIGLITGFIMFFILYSIFLKTKKVGKENAETLNKFSASFIDYFNGIKPLIAMGNITKLEKVFTKQLEVVKKSNIILAIIKNFLQSAQELIRVVSLTLLLYFILKNQILSFELILTISIIFLRAIASFSELQKEFQRTTAINYSYNIVTKNILDARKNQDDIIKGRKVNFSNKITLKNISFNYSNKKIFEGINLEIKFGKLISIVGASGIGKTTLLDIILGLLKPNDGNISVDNINIEKIDSIFWRKQIGYVPQDSFLFNDTLYNNIVMDLKNQSTESVFKVLKKCQLSEYANLDELNKSIGDGGKKLSGGQRQRISLARSLIRNPRLLILDEFTSSLDDDTENEILSTIDKLKKSTTIVAISHKKSIINLSDDSYTLVSGTLKKVK